MNTTAETKESSHAGTFTLTFGGKESIPLPWDVAIEPVVAAAQGKSDVIVGLALMGDEFDRMNLPPRPRPKPITVAFDEIQRKRRRWIIPWRGFR
jgi:hypothetical protein